MQANVIKAVAHPVRLAIVDFLKDGEQCVCDIALHVGAERSNVSRHLALLLKGGILKYRRSGLKAMYSLKTPCVLNFLSCVSDVLRGQIKSNSELLKKL